MRTLCKKDARPVRTSGVVLCRISPLGGTHIGIDLARTTPSWPARARGRTCHLCLEGLRKPRDFASSMAHPRRRNTMGGRFAVRLALIGLLAGGAVVGCSNNDDESGPQTGVLSVRITDAPAQFDQVNLVVTEVAVFRGATLPADSDSVAGWQVVRSSSVTVNLVTLRNGGSLQLVVGRVPAGTYSRMRLKLGTGSTVVV